jgi:transposase
VTYRYCPECLKKQQRINELEEQVVLLKGRLRYQERTVKEGLFGSSTPSSKLPVKPNALAQRQARHGGGKPGHAGHGRTSVESEQADRVETIAVAGQCPDCGTPLQNKGTRDRSVIDCQPLQSVRIVYRLQHKYCPNCKRTVRARAPGVLPKSLYGNRLLTHVAVQHYLYGVPLGQLEQQTGIGYGSLVDAMHQLARWLKDVPETLVQAYRKAPVKHADETGWRTDGRNGYAWLFCTPSISIFRFRGTRRAQIAQDVLGDKPLPGVLVVDRYNAYNKSPCKLQYCYAHLLRTVKELLKNFPDNPEGKAFVDALAPLLASAIRLRSEPITHRQFKRQATQIKSQIIQVVHQQAQHPAIQSVQDIFRQNAHRLYHWADDRNVPADNNLAERDLRPLVIARKISFGSQSDAGAHTRETLMTVLRTLKKRTPDVAHALNDALDKLSLDPTLDAYAILFPADTS